MDEEIKAIDQIIPKLEKILANDENAKGLELRISGPRPTVPGGIRQFYGPLRIIPGEDDRFAKALIEYLKLHRSIISDALANTRT